MRFGQARNRLRSSDADRTTKNALHIVGDVLELGPAAGQNDLPADRA
jgi:hypothetical protein